MCPARHISRPAAIGCAASPERGRGRPGLARRLPRPALAPPGGEGTGGDGRGGGAERSGGPGAACGRG